MNMLGFRMPSTLDQAVAFYTPAVAARIVAVRKWPPNGAPFCPTCSSFLVGHLRRRDDLFFCRDCGDQFSIKTNTVAAGSHLPLSAWLVAAWCVVDSGGKDLVTCRELSAALGVNLQSAAKLLRMTRQLKLSGRDAVSSTHQRNRRRDPTLARRSALAAAG
jgi:transposase-like protein